MDVDTAVQERYSSAAQHREAALCCPVADYAPELLAAIPAEVIERDYGCGDPSRFVGPGDTVLDLGSGGGKICFIASQLVGPRGRVIGIDRNREMLDLARHSASRVAEAIGFANCEFRVGNIQDLGLDLEREAPELCGGYRLRHPRETKNGQMPTDYGSDQTTACCQPGSGCC